MSEIETLNTITSASGFLGLMMCVVAFVFYKNSQIERLDRKEAWKTVNELTGKMNEILIKNSEVMSGINNVLEDIKDVIYNKK